MSRILLVDADTADRGILRSRLTDAGHEVRTAESAERGIELALGAAHDLLLVAARLDAGRSGPDVCRTLLAHHGLEETLAVVYSTGDPLGPTADAAYDASAALALGPQDLDHLEGTLECLLRTRARSRALQEVHDLVGIENRRLAEALRRGAGPTGGEEGAAHPAVAGRPDALLIVDRAGQVRWSDRGAGALFGRGLDGVHLRELAPESDLAGFVRAARRAPNEGLRFDLPVRRDQPRRPVVASVFPLGRELPGSEELALVLLNDVGKRRVAEEVVRGHRPTIPKGQVAALMEAARRHYGLRGVPGDGPAAEALRGALARRAADRDPVLLVGERGTGRAFLARVLHHLGDEPGAFLDLACAALAPEALAAELLGHTRGAFEGALADRPGLLLLADGGTLYLSEIEELPLELQEELLRVLRARKVRRPGARRAERTAPRLVASSTTEPAELVAAGRLHPELAERLSAGRVDVPPLRERGDELPGLIAAQLERLGGVALEERARAVLLAHGWPRNLDELAEELAAAAERAGGGELRVEHLSPALRELAAAQARARDVLVPRPPGGGPAAQGPQRAGASPWEITEQDPISFELYERKAILRALHRCGGDKLRAAKLLAIGKSTLYRKLKRLGIV